MQVIPFPDEKEQLKKNIIELAKKVGYEEADRKIVIITSNSGDLHSNASVD